MVLIYIRLRTTNSKPPPNLMFIYALLGFLMSIAWIGFASDFVVDLLVVMSLVLNLPPAALGFSILAWGNCFADMKCNTAMAKKGFGEMAITACISGPVFNLNFGLGLPFILLFLNPYKQDLIPGGYAGTIRWSLFTEDGSFNSQ